IGKKGLVSIILTALFLLPFRAQWRRIIILWMMIAIGGLAGKQMGYAQIHPIEYPSGQLSEERIAEILENSRKSGTNEWEIQKANESLHKQLRAQQQAILEGTYNQRNNQPPHVNSTACVNPGFESNNTTGWALFSGNIMSINLPCNTCPTTPGAITNVVNATSTIAGQCSSGIDMYGGFSVVAPPPIGGSYSLLLNDVSVGGKIEQAQYAFVVNSSTDFFTFQYAVVLQSGGHPTNEQPYFNVDVTDVTTGSVVACTAYSQNAPTSGTLAGWSISSVDNTVYTKNWATVGIDLSTVIGHTVSVNFTVSDCNQGGHFGYCYIDANCGNAFSATNVSGICGNSGNITLNGPPGYLSYQWYGPNPPYPIISGATASTYSISSAASTDTFKVVGTFAAGCTDTFKITVKPILNILAYSNPTCRGNSVGSATVTAGTGNFSYAWSGPSGSMGTFTTTSQNNLPPGTYTVQVVDNTSYCPSKDTTITVSVVSPTLQTSTVQFCGLTPTLMAPNAETGTPYTWYNTTNSLIAGVTTQTNTISGAVNGQHYTVTYLDSTTHCEDSLRITLNKTTLNFATIPQNPCSGGNNGGLTYNNNTSPNLYSSYNWVVSGATSSSGTVTASVSINLSGLGNGTYTMIISAPGNTTCCDTLRTILSNTAAIVPSPDSLPPYCNMDTITINPTTPNVTHSWSGVGLSGSNTSIPLVVNPPFTVTTPGYYNYTDSMHSIPGGCLSITKYIVSIKSFKGSLSAVEQLKCHNDSIGKIKANVTSEINGPVNSPDDYTFTWSPSSLTTTTASGYPCSSIKSNLKGLTYTCTISNGNCINTYTYNLVNPPALHTDSLYAYYCPKDSIALLVANTGHTFYHWHWLNHIGSTVKDSLLSNTTDSLVGIALTQNINNYYVTYKNNGCPDTGKIIVPVTTYNAFVPNELVNVFSPNGDNRNDVFYPFYQSNISQYEIGKQSKIYELKIYDRWGTLMFETNDYTKPWDGKTISGHTAVDGTYFFYVKYESNCGTNANLANKKGFVELMR
ncbi:MAG: T9SS type B sorting domain-containing protein, partial [Bacteroidia bacterium]